MSSHIQETATPILKLKHHNEMKRTYIYLIEYIVLAKHTIQRMVNSAVSIKTKPQNDISLRSLNVQTSNRRALVAFTINQPPFLRLRLITVPTLIKHTEPGLSADVFQFRSISPQSPILKRLRLLVCICLDILKLHSSSLEEWEPENEQCQTFCEHG